MKLKMIMLLLILNVVTGTRLRGTQEEDYCEKCWRECGYVFHDRFCARCTDKCGTNS
jgi:hypothetical protein